MLRKRHRLRKNAEFQRVREKGQSRVHPLMVMQAVPNGLDFNRYGFSASRRVGNAVARNRAKRLMREAVRVYQVDIKPGWDIVFIARPRLCKVEGHQAAAAAANLLRRAGLLTVSAREKKEAPG